MAADIIPIELGLTAGNGLTLWAPQLAGGRRGLGGLPRARGRPVRASRRPRTWPPSSAPPPSTTCSIIPSGRRRPSLLVDELHAGRRPQLRHRRRAGAGGRAAGHLDAGRADRHHRDPALAGRGLRAGRDRRRARLRRRVRLLPPAQLAFTGRNGEKLWNEIGAVVVDRWDEVVDALDGIVTTPEVDPEALAIGPGRGRRDQRRREAAGDRRRRNPPRTRTADEDLEFWDETGVDCLEITVGGRTGYTLRCYLGDDPVFLSERRPDPDLRLARGPGELPDRGRRRRTRWPP